MKKSLRFTAQDVLDYKNQIWFNFASQSTSEGRIKLDFSAMGEYRVTLDGEMLYQGDLTKAIEVWEKNT